MIAALGSYLDARACGGRWLLRIDDLDRLRSRRGADDAILFTLEHLGLHWDGPVQRQRHRFAEYEKVLAHLRRAGWLYACRCPRRLVAGRPYPGTCRELGLEDGPGRALRMRMPNDGMPPVDRSGDAQQDAPPRAPFDFIVRRADGIPSYHLATVVDDDWQGVTDVVRGMDLQEAMPAQVALYRALGRPVPAYFHLPLAVDPGGRKLSKRMGAEDALVLGRPGDLLLAILQFLGQSPCPSLAGAPAREVIQWATLNWSRDRVPRAQAMQPVLPA